MPKVGKRRVKKRSHQPDDSGETEKKYTPRSFIVKRGRVNNSVNDLVQDFRDVMSPNCAKALRETKSTKIRDYLSVSGMLGVTHLTMLSNNETSTYMRIARLPQGPTLTFKVNKFSLARDIQSRQKRPRRTKEDFNHPPLLLMNSFGGQEENTKLTSEVIRNMFQPIDVDSFSTKNCRRTCLFHREKNGNIQFRHYAISQKMHGVSRSVRRLVDGKAKIGVGQDVADFILGGGYASDSEFEDDEPAEIRRSKKSNTSETVGLNLVELGPRMELIPVKAEEGVMDGIVLFHKFVSKTPEEKEIADKKAHERKTQREKNERLAVKKLAQKAELKKKRAEKDRKKQERMMPDLSDDEGRGDAEERRNKSLFQQEWDGKDDKMNDEDQEKKGVEVRPGDGYQKKKRERYNPFHRKKKQKMDNIANNAAIGGGKIKNNGKKKDGKSGENITKWNEKKTLKSGGHKKKLKLKHTKK